jgi:hypothetical protein
VVGQLAVVHSQPRAVRRARRRWSELPCRQRPQVLQEAQELRAGHLPLLER